MVELEELGGSCGFTRKEGHGTRKAGKRGFLGVPERVWGLDVWGVGRGLGRVRWKLGFWRLKMVEVAGEWFLGNCG